MRLRWFFPFAVLLPLRLFAADNAVKPRVATITINPSEVITLHLRPEFESTIHMPEEITSVILGSPGSFKAEHNEGEPEYVYVKPITKEAAESNLLIATKSGLHVTLELISDEVGASGSALPVDFLIEYRTSRSFLIAGSAGAEHTRVEPTGIASYSAPPRISAAAKPLSAIDEEYELQMRIWSDTIPADSSWMRPNRRHIWNGLYLPGVVREGVGEIAIAVDCSGSVNGRLLRLFEAEVCSILEGQRPQCVHVLYFDTEVHKVETYQAGETVHLNPVGGGGTDFGPCFDWLKEHGTRPQTLVFLTDLYGTFPDDAPGYPVLWASTGSRHAPFGSVIPMNAA